MINEGTMTYRDLLGNTDSGRRRRASTVRVKPRAQTTDDKNREKWNFGFKSYPSTTGLPWVGYIKFPSDLTEARSADDTKDIKIHCTCPDYFYSCQHANVSHDVDDGLDNGPGKGIKNPQNKPRLCKHLSNLASYLDEKIKESCLPLAETLSQIEPEYDIEENDMIHEQEQQTAPEIDAQLMTTRMCNFSDDLFVHRLEELLPSTKIAKKGDLVRIEYLNFVAYLQPEPEQEDVYSLLVANIDRTEELAKYEDISASEVEYHLLSWMELDEDPEFNEKIVKMKGQSHDGRVVDEGFDPTSMGPNLDATEGTSVYNPYPQMNADMADQEVEAFINEIEGDEEIDLNELLAQLQKEDQEAASSRPEGLDNLTIADGVHGREAQLAGAGEFDPRTFGDMDEMYLTKPTYLRKKPVKEEGPNFGKRYVKHGKKPVKPFGEAAGAPAAPMMNQGSGDQIAIPDDDNHFTTEPPMSAVNIDESDVRQVLDFLKKSPKSTLRETFEKVGKILGY